MKKSYILGALGLMLISLSTSACSNSSNDTTAKNSHSSKAEKVENAVSDSSVNSSTQGFKGNTYTTKTGTISIGKVTNVKVHDADMDPENYTMVVIEGTFTNKSKKSVAPYEWIMSNLEINQVLPNSERELEVPSSRQHDNGTKWDSLFKNSESKVLPGKTIKFALEYDLDSKTDKVTATYSIQAESSEDGHHIGKPYKVKAGSDIFTNKVSYSDSSDTSSSDSDTNDDKDTPDFDPEVDKEKDSNDTSKDSDKSSDESDSDKNSSQSDEDTNDNADTDE